MRQSRSIWCMALIVLVAAFASQPAQAEIVDQYSGRGNTTGFPPVSNSLSELLTFQLFKPSVSPCVGFDAMVVLPESGATITGELRQYPGDWIILPEIITGPLVASASWTGTMGTDHEEHDNGYISSWISFRFDETVMLTPGAIYQLEIFSEEDVLWVMEMSWESSDFGDQFSVDIYEDGMAIEAGSYRSTFSDFIFKTYTTPEPATMSLLGLGAVALLRRRK